MQSLPPHFSGFLPGSKVTCIREDFGPDNKLYPGEAPQRGATYTVRALGNARGVGREVEGLSILLDDLKRVDSGLSGDQVWWSVANFRPAERPAAQRNALDERVASKTALSVKPFRSLATKLLLRRAQQSNRWLQLKDSNLGLAVAALFLRPWPKDPRRFSAALEDFLGQKRKAMCSALGFPPATTTLRILAHLDDRWLKPRELGIPGWLKCLRYLLWHDADAVLFLLRSATISPPTIRWIIFGGAPSILDYMTPLGLGFIERDLARADWFFKLPSLRRCWLVERFDFIRWDWFDCLGILPRLRKLGSFKKESEAAAYIQGRQAMLATVRRILDEVGATTFEAWPQPPLDGKDLLEPILSYKELVKEGRQLKHCIARYAKEIILGTYYAYRLRTPMRCTVGVGWGRGHWQLCGIKGLSNADPSAEVQTLVKSWLESQPEARKRNADRSPLLPVIRQKLRERGIPTVPASSPGLQTLPSHGQPLDQRQM